MNHFSIVVELRMHGIALPRCRIGIGILFLFLRGKTWYWYFIAKIINARIGIEIVLVYNSLQSPTLKTWYHDSYRSENLKVSIPGGPI